MTGWNDVCWGEVLEIVDGLLNHTKSSESKAMVDVGLGLVACGRVF